jgi:hypothetical protein
MIWAKDGRMLILDPADYPMEKYKKFLKLIER